MTAATRTVVGGVRETVVGRIDSPPCPDWCEAKHDNRWDEEAGYLQHSRLISEGLRSTDADSGETLPVEVWMYAVECVSVGDETFIIRSLPYVEVREKMPEDASFQYDITHRFASPEDLADFADAMKMARDVLMSALAETQS